MELTDKRIVFNSDARLTLSAGTNDAQSGGNSVLSGYAMIWNAVSDDRGGFKIRLMPNSANFSANTFALYNHEFSNVLGSTANGTLKLTPDSVGVRVEINLPNTTLGNDVKELVAQRYVTGMSFSMLGQGRETNEVKENGQTIFNVTKFISDEVTVTPIPAFGETSIGVVPPKDFSKVTEEIDRQLSKLHQTRLFLYERILGQSIPTSE